MRTGMSHQGLPQGGALARRNRGAALWALLSVLVYFMMSGCTLAQTTGSVVVTLSPTSAVAAGARWRIDGGTWRVSGATLAGVATGTHTVSYRAATGFKTPASASVNVVENATTPVSAVYVPTGSVLATIEPALAVAEGAQWRVDTGAWRASGTTASGITEGAHTVSFKTVTGWKSPAKVAVNVTAGATASVTGTYSPIGAVKVTLSPAEAVTAGAQWKLDAGAWRASGVTLTGLSEGTHTLSFRAVTGWTSPATRSVNIVRAQTLNITAAYSQGGKVSVSIDPSPVRDEGAKWALDGGTWNASGTTLDKVSPGTHTITYAAVNGWTSPVASTITVSEGQLSTMSPLYTLTLGSHVAFAFNDLGMHCMNEDFSEFMILPPYNTVKMQVIRRGAEPHLTTSGISISYRIPGNTTSVTKTNFWQYAPQLFGAPLAPDLGLTGNRLSGTMKRTADNEALWEVTGIPITPVTDAGELDPYQLGEFKVFQGSTQIARTNTVVPVSWEISCNICHDQPGASVGTNILRAHDRMHGTDLEHAKPVVCGACHGQPPLGLPGEPGLHTLSGAMHSSHATRMAGANLANSCYACHPGFETNCQRDVHFERGVGCTDCHGGMAEVGNPARRPWEDEPRCGSCHQRQEFTFEEPGKLYRDSRGHHEVMCATCHGSPHAITPTVTAADNVQALMLQGHVGTIDKCSVCHVTTPRDKFEHHL